jgi:hypothetical protein
VCQLERDATAFDHKVVQVRGSAGLGFEVFTLGDRMCNESSSTPVWLTFGGDVSDIATYCCGDHSRAHGKNLEIEGRSAPLQKDSNYERFQKLLRASRSRKPNGEPCYQGCPFYRVSATLTGLFLARRENADGVEGYGHLSCCSLFIIQQITDVSADRTAVPAGAFLCEKSDWKPAAQEAPEFVSYLECASNCDHETEAAIKRSAAHWKDNIEFSKGGTGGSYTDTTSAHPVDHLRWASDDSLMNYVIVGEKTKPPKVSVTREACRLTTAAPSDAESIFCDDFVAGEWSFERRSEYLQLVDAKEYKKAENMIVESAERLSVNGDQSWRTRDLPLAAHEVLTRQIEDWKVPPNPDLRADRCSDPESLDDQQYEYASCSWYSPDGMQDFTVNLMRPKQGSAATLGPARWSWRGADARVCHGEPTSLATDDAHQD